MRSWIREGRVSADSLVWREGWPQWRVAAQAFPQLTSAPAQAIAPTPPQQEIVPDPATEVTAGVHAGVDIGVDIDGSVRGERDVEIENNPLLSPPLSGSILPSPEFESEAIEAALVGTGFTAIASLEDDATPLRRAARRAPAGRRGLDRAVMIAGLFVTLAILVAVLIYLLFFRGH